MKRLFAAVFILFALCVSAQNWKPYASIVTAGDSLGSAITLDAGYLIFGVELPDLADGTNSLSFDAEGQQNGSTWSPVWYNGKRYALTIDSTHLITALEPKAMVIAQTIRPVLNKVQTATDTLWFQAVKQSGR